MGDAVGDVWGKSPGSPNLTYAADLVQAKWHSIQIDDDDEEEDYLDVKGVGNG